MPKLYILSWLFSTLILAYYLIEHIVIKVCVIYKDKDMKCLTLNESKTVGMYFSITRKNTHQTDMTVKGEVIKTVEHFMYLGIIINSNSTCKTPTKQKC